MGKKTRNRWSLYGCQIQMSKTRDRVRDNLVDADLNWGEEGKGILLLYQSYVL